MKHRGVLRSEAASVPIKVTFEQQMLSVMLLSFALISEAGKFAQIPTALLPVIFVFAMAASRPVARPQPKGQFAQPESEVPAALTEPKIQIVPAESEMLVLRPVIEVEGALPATKAGLWQHAVDDIGRRHHCKFKFMLSPLIFGPDDEVLPILDVCFPESSTSSTTLRDREAILLGRQLYPSVACDCGQKRFAGLVARDYQEAGNAQLRSKPSLSDDTCGRLLSGSYPTLKNRLSKSISS